MKIIREKKVNGQIYHVYNRGVEKRLIFMEDADYLRYVHDLFAFNDIATVPRTFSYFERRGADPAQSFGVRLRKIERRPRKLLVDLLAFCLMPNHVHLVVRQRIESGITEFMRKLGTGYTNYFNTKYERVGPLFQGKYKYVRVAREEHFLHLPYYIHANPLDLTQPRWREKEMKDKRKAARFLASYRWSSHQDYAGQKNFPSVTQREFLLKFFGSTQQYREDFSRWLCDMGGDELQKITLE